MRSNHHYGSAVIYLVESSPLAYYSGDSVRHYITGTAIYSIDGTFFDYNDMNLEVADPNNDMSYYGYHTVDFLEMVEALQNYLNVSGNVVNFVW